MQINNIELKWLGHASFLIKDSKTGKTIYIDPYNISNIPSGEKADIILITHSHYDHCSIADIEKLAKDGTIIVTPADCQSKITKLTHKIQMQVIEPGDKIKLGNIGIDIVPAYNKDKEFHPKTEGWIGYIIKIENIAIYHAGDTDIIPEMQKLTGYGKKEIEFIALLPVGGKFTMNAEEAAQAAIMMKPNLAIPMHFGSVIGASADAERFVQLCEEAGINAKILEKE